ncbi:hypothetical protein ACLOJK_021749 [Asimina triloba]
MKNFAAFLLVLVLAQLLAEPSHAGSVGASSGADIVACARVAGLVGECFTYLTGIDQRPMLPCCNGLLGFARSAAVLQDHQLACRCFKRAISTFQNIRPDALDDLPAQCHVQLTISPATC